MHTHLIHDNGIIHINKEVKKEVEEEASAEGREEVARNNINITPCI